jgi:8-amino-7-oxononanoate synthase
MKCSLDFASANEPRFGCIRACHGYSWLVNFENDAGHRLAELAAKRQLRSSLTVSGRRGSYLEIAGRWLSNFSSNDYLGYASDSRIVEAGHRELERSGAGATASRLVVGNMTAHVELQDVVQRWLQFPSVCLFNSGYAANTGVLPALAGPGDVILSDQLNHASIIDGCRLSGAEVQVYRHADVDDISKRLALLDGRRIVVVTESVFSMDGDCPDLAAINVACDRFGAALVVDEAHALGAVGPMGRGECARQKVVPTVLIGTFGKALGVYGAFAATTPNVASWLWNRARSLVFTTGLPPVVAAMCSAAVELAKASDGDQRRADLSRVVKQFSDGRKEILSENRTIKSSPQSSYIVPWVVGEETKALTLSESLQRSGMLVSAIRPPTVAAGSSRLRICLSSGQSSEQLEQLLQHLAKETADVTF